MVATDTVSARRNRAAPPRGAGAPHPVAVDRTAAPRDAKPRGADEGPLSHHAAAVSLLAATAHADRPGRRT